MPDQLWVNVAYIDRLIKRFNLQTAKRIHEAIPMQGLVVPVTQIDELLKDFAIVSTNEDLTAAAGTYVPYFTCPEGKRWKLLIFFRATTAAGSMVRIFDGTTHLTLLSSQMTAGSFYNVNAPLKEGWSVGMTTTGNGADGAITLSICYTEEESY